MIRTQNKSPEKTEPAEPAEKVSELTGPTGLTHIVPKALATGPTSQKPNLHEFRSTNLQQHLTSSLWGPWGLGGGGPLLGERPARGRVAVRRGVLGVCGWARAGLHVLLPRSVLDTVLLWVILPTELGHLLGQHQLGLLLQLPDVLDGEPVPLVLPAPGLPVGPDHHLPQACKARTSLSPEHKLQEATCAPPKASHSMAGTPQWHPTTVLQCRTFTQPGWHTGHLMHFISSIPPVHWNQPFFCHCF